MKGEIMENERLQEFVKRVLDKDTLFKYLEDREKHILLWTYLGEQEYKNKAEFFEYFEIRDIPMNNCYACDCVRENCDICPIKWRDSNRCCFSEYGDWQDAEIIEEKSRLAFKIANLEWKEKGE